jgi:hypothetical protein
MIGHSVDSQARSIEVVVAGMVSGRAKVAS